MVPLKTFACPGNKISRAGARACNSPVDFNEINMEFDEILKWRILGNSKINGTPKDIYLPISKLHSMLAVANLLAHNNLRLCYYGQVNSLRLK